MVDSSDNTNSSSLHPKPLHVGKPAWLKSKIPSGDTYFQIKRDLRNRTLYTVCEEAKCPNIDECWSSNTATFMVLGDTCTRACRFCNVKTGNPGGKVDPNEPQNVADTIKSMGLKYAVITMVDRDDMEDGGAAHVGQVMAAIRTTAPACKIELLAGDFHGSSSALQTLLEMRPEVYAHNLETVRRLTPRVRDARASYDQSLKVLSLVKELASYRIFTKSALMLGLGETMEDISEALKDLRDHQVDFLTVGQYLRPTKQHLSIKRFVPPEEFKEVERMALEAGFKAVASSPLVRSSYHAREFYEKAAGSAP